MATKKSTKKATTKTAKKSESAKVTKASAAQTNRANKTTSKQLLTRMNLLIGLLSLALAALAGFFMNHTSYQLFTGLLTRDELASKVSTVFVPAIHAVYDLELRWAVVVIMAIAAIVPLLAATRNRRQYEASLAKKVMLWRWIDMAVVSALMIEVLALISGVQDIATLKLIAALMVVTCILGWLSEKQNANSSKPIWDTYILSLVTGILPWLLIATYAVGTPLYGMVRSPWFVYALYGTTITAFIGYSLNGMRQLKRLQAYEVTERNYLWLGVFAKVAFAAILIIGLKK